jgi:hypothetical protein
MRQCFQEKDSLDRALIFLTHLSPYKQEMGTTEIRNKLGSLMKTISRDIQNLVTNRFPTQNSKAKMVAWVLTATHVEQRLSPCKRKY